MTIMVTSCAYHDHILMISWYQTCYLILYKSLGLLVDVYSAIEWWWMISIHMKAPKAKRWEDSCHNLRSAWKIMDALFHFHMITWFSQRNPTLNLQAVHVFWQERLYKLPSKRLKIVEISVPHSKNNHPYLNPATDNPLDFPKSPRHITAAQGDSDAVQTWRPFTIP